MKYINARARKFLLPNAMNAIRAALTALEKGELDWALLNLESAERSLTEMLSNLEPDTHKNAPVSDQGRTNVLS